MEKENFKLSYSKIKVFNECKIKYTFKYIIKIPNIHQTFSTLTGTLLHKFSELYLLGYSYNEIYKKYSNKDLVLNEVLKDYLERLKLDIGDNRELEERYISIIKGVLGKEFIPLWKAFSLFKEIRGNLDLLKSAFNQIEPEKEKGVFYKNLKFYGIVDIFSYDKDNGYYGVFDIKTGNPDNYSINQLYFYLFLLKDEIDLNSKNILLGFINPKYKNFKKYKINNIKSLTNKIEKILINKGEEIYNFSRYVNNKIAAPVINEIDIDECAVRIEKKEKFNKNESIVKAAKEIKSLKYSKEDKLEWCNFCEYRNICKEGNIV